MTSHPSAAPLTPGVIAPEPLPGLSLFTPSAASTAVDATPAGCADARRWADRELLRLGVTGVDLRDDVALVVSELVSNAIQHGVAPIRLAVSYVVPDLLVAVSDGGGPPYLLGSRTPDPVAPRGRGLGIVAALGTAWGTRALRPGPGKSVWCRLRDAGPVDAA